MTDMAQTPERQDMPARANRMTRMLPILAIAAGAGAALWFFGDLLSFQTLADNRETLIAWRDSHFAMAIAAFFALYVLAVAFSIPGAIWLTIAAGFLFGTVGATVLVVLAATAGATAIFLAARTSLADLLRAKAAGWIDRIERQLEGGGAVSLMLVMRLVPAVPFFIANLVPAFLNIPLRTFVWTTLIGIIPGTAVFASLGAGLGTTLDQGGAPDLGIIFQPHVLGPLIGLAALSLLPVVVKRLRSAKD